MKRLFQTIKNFDPTISFVLAMPATWLIWIALLLLGYRLSPSEWVMTWIICFCGYIGGMPFGMLASPHKGEARNFQLIGSHLATLFSGYVLAKLASSGVEGWLRGAASDQLRGGRIMLFMSFLILGLVQTFILRNYSDKEREQDRYEQTKPKEKANEKEK